MTTAAVPSTDPVDFLLNVETFDAAINSTNPTLVDRLGTTRSTLHGAIDSIKAFNNRGAWVAITPYDGKDLVSNAGTWYVCVVPHTSSEAFATDTASKWRVYQGITLPELAAPTGSSLMGFLPAGADAVPTTGEAKLREIVSICDFGGIDDWNGTTGTDNFSAFSKIYADYPNGVTIKMPKLGTGIYLSAGSGYTPSGEGFILDPDEGVSIRNTGGAIPCLAIGVKSTRRIAFRNTSNMTDSYMSPVEYKLTSEKGSFMNADDGERPVLASINHTTAQNHVIPWPNGPVADATPTTITADTTVWAPNFSNFNLTTVPLRPGSEVSAYFHDDATSGFPYTGGLMAGVVTDAGFAIVRQDMAGGVLISGVKSGAAAIVEVGLVPPTYTYQAYRFAHGLVAVRVHTPTSFSVLVNGIEVARVADAGGVILRAGFGAGFATGSYGISVAGMSTAKNVRAMGVQPLKIVVVGDSITDPLMGCSWSDFLRQYLSGVGGVQMLDIMNLAASGATSTGQAGLLTATAIEGYQYCLIQIGVNDIQGGAAVATLMSNITAMVNYCVTNGVIPIVGIPTMWYGQSDAAPFGNTGQSTLNKEQGSPYRSTLLRQLAASGVAVNLMTLSDFGAVIPTLLTTPKADQVVYDNVHPTVYGRMVLAYAWAKTLIGKMIPKVDKTITVRTIPVAWSGSTYGTTGLPAYSVTGDLCSITGSISSSADPLDGAVVFTLPESLVPLNAATFSVPVATSAGTPSGVAILQVTGAGLVKIYAAPVGTRYIYLGITFQIAG